MKYNHLVDKEQLQFKTITRCQIKKLNLKKSQIIVKVIVKRVAAILKVVESHSNIINKGTE